MSIPIPYFEGRPPIVVQNGITVYISVHDRRHVEERKQWKAKLISTHSDTGGTDYKSAEVIKKYKRWKMREEKWYRHYGLEPPAPGELRSLVIDHTPPIKAKYSAWEEKKITAGMCRSCGEPRGSNGTMTKCRACAERDRLKRRNKLERQGLCGSCAKPRGEDGTASLCRKCATTHSRRERDQRNHRGQLFSTIIRHGLPRGVKGVHTVVWHTEEEKRVWRELARQQRKTLTKFIRDAVRAQHAYILTQEF